VSNISDTVKELRGQAGPEPDARIEAWLAGRPLRFGHARDADVQQFLQRGVKIIDGLEARLPLSLSRGQREIRARCDELSKSMQKVLDRRADEPEPFDPWKPVRVRVETVKSDRALSAGETRGRYVQALRGCFPGGPAQADRARTQYRVWEQNAERLHREGPMNEAAQSWKRFMGVIDNMRNREEAKGLVWGRVDDVGGIDFRPALQPRQSFRQRPRQRM
jgi:hypothetical protein